MAAIMEAETETIQTAFTDSIYDNRYRELKKSKAVMMSRAKLNTACFPDLEKGKSN